jgi:sec-independent protein translocase protein TatC
MATTGQEVSTKKKKNKKPEVKVSAGQMTFMEHLKELRNRIIMIAIALVITIIIAFAFSKELVQLFIDLGNSAVKEGQKFNPISITTIGPFAAFFNVAFVVGILLASPMIVYQLLAFLAPALEPESQPGEPGYDQEVALVNSIKRSLWFMIPGIVVSFSLGVLFAYYLVLPNALRFILNYPDGIFEVSPDILNFIGTCTQVMFWCGVVFQMPLIMFMLARLKILTWKQMAGWWKFALVLALVVAALVNPSPDIIIQFVVSVPIYGLYWLGVLLARFA